MKGVVWLNIAALLAAILVVWLAPWFIVTAAARWWEGRDVQVRERSR